MVLGALTYVNGLQGPFIFDDFAAVVRNPHIRGLWPPTRVLSAPPNTSASGRPLVCLSLAVNYAMGGLREGGYHIFNLALHLISGLLLFGIVRNSLKLPAVSPRFGKDADWLAGVVAGLWLVHPLQTEAVTYVIQRTELLAGLFYLLTLYAAIRYWGRPSDGRWLVLSVAACAMGMGSKETMVTAPIAVLLYDAVLVSDGLKVAWRRHTRLYVGMSLTWLVLLYLVAKGNRSASAGMHLEISPNRYLLTQAGVILHYLRLALWPRPLVISYDDWPIASRPQDVWPQLLVVLMLLALTIWGLARRRPAAFLAAGFFLILAPTSSILPIVTEVAAERRMYLPLAALISGAVCGGYVLLSRLRSPPGRTMVSAGLVLLIGALMIAATIERNRDYRSAESIWGDLVQKRPAIAFGHFEYANALAADGKSYQAVHEYEEALRLKPDYPEALTNFANVLADRGELEKAIAMYEKAIHVDPRFVEAHNNLGTVFVAQRKWDAAVVQFRQALEARPNWGPALCNLGEAYRSLGRVDDAIETLQSARKAEPTSVPILLALADALAEKGLHGQAAQVLRDALALDPANQKARERLEEELAKPGK